MGAAKPTTSAPAAAAPSPAAATATSWAALARATPPSQYRGEGGEEATATAAGFPAAVEGFRGAVRLAGPRVDEGRGEGGDRPRGVVGPCHRQGLAVARDAWRGEVGAAAAGAAVGAEITLAKGVGPEARTVRRGRVR